MIRRIFSTVRLTTYVIIISAFGSHPSSFAQISSEGTTTSKFAMFASEELLQTSINFDLGRYLKKRLKGESIDGNMIINITASDSNRYDIRIKTRGVFRQQYCSFPPMEIGFLKPMSAYLNSGSFKKLKLVTHCEQGRGSDDYVLREYLVYKLFNVLTDTSYRVRLLKLNYIDSEKNKKTISQYGFFIEPHDILAQRINAIRLKKTTITQKHIIPDVITRLAIFNYMIGNYDWAVPNQHNVAIFKSLDFKKSQLAIAVPYDFDFTGLVNPYYALPTDETGLKSIRERLFTGMCRTEEDFKKELFRILSHKAELLSVINDFPYINQATKTDITDYLNEFFYQVENTRNLDGLIKTLMNSCKQL